MDINERLRSNAAKLRSFADAEDQNWGKNPASEALREAAKDIEYITSEYEFEEKPKSQGRRKQTNTKTKKDDAE